MGLLSFLSKRSGDGAKSKSKTGESVPVETARVQSRLPGGERFFLAVNLRNHIASAPLAHNATSAAEEALRGCPPFSQTRLSLDADDDAEAAAPAPAVPLSREESIERPSTAPNESKPVTVWASNGGRLRKKSIRGAPPVSFRMVRPSTANPIVRSVSQSGIMNPVNPGGQGSRTHSRSNSISNSTRSDGSMAYKDLLDAQSEIKPADFRTRVKASGARDYGEDVAERNLGENGFNLESAHVQAFYAQSTNLSEHPKLGESAAREPHSRITIASIRTKSLNSSAAFIFPKAAAHIPLIPRIHPPDSVAATDARSSLLRRRQSVNTYMTGSLLGRENDSLPQRSTGPRAASNPTRYDTTPEDEKVSWDLPTLSSLGLSEPITTTRPRTARLATSQPPRLPHDSMLVAKQRAGTPMPNHVFDDDDEGSYPFPDAMVSPLRTSSRPRRGSVASPTISPRKRHSLHILQRSASFASHDPTFDPAPLSYPRHKNQHMARSRLSEQLSVASLPDSLTIDFDVASSPTKPTDLRSHHLRGPFTIHEISEVPEAEPEDCPNQRTNPDDSPSQTTLRTRSLRAWSASSATPTTSDTSSNPFRPQSRHTANTSIDLSNGAPSLNKVPSHGSLDSRAAMSPRTAKPSNFNIDDYISSDDDSFMEPRRPRAEGEEELLFSDAGYGAAGFQLPGLEDQLPTSRSPQSNQLLQHARSSISLPPIYDCDSFGRAGGRRFILDTAADSDDEDEQYHAAKDISPLRGMRGTKRLSAICGSPLKQPHAGYTHDVIEEERTGKVDIATAVRLRKEAKARKRASGVSLARPRKARSAMPLGIPGNLEVPADDEANHADVE